ncbi:HEAT repeat domain-containing protein [Aliikangiella marina]|uniref:HEAT repeat domain-containing protein n=1 Tax=Aliikangiella marina TaxID=1712262 RepID=A0A545T4I9_9GAMM|nr:HEAT repeat domain-containing protein [Aliikangiella marina]TQV72088.1 HEAT repeat domain-containing protein [Aliikangiella marina]
MNEQQLIQQDDELIVAYLYDELSEQSREAFEKRLQNDPSFCEKYNQHSQLDQLMSRGNQPIISDQRADAVRWSLQRKLRKEAAKRQSKAGWLQNLWTGQVSFKYQFASMVATFALGFYVAGEREVIIQPVADNSQQSELLAFVEKDDLHITDMQLKQVDTQSGDIQVVYSLASRTQLDANLSNQKVQGLLAKTMQDDVSDSTRLDLVDLLKDYSNTQSVRNALSHSLLNDPNPGVRMVAAESLAKISHDENVRDVLRVALQGDVNPGVRVEAFQALIQHLDDKKTIEVLKNHSANDSNLYIRNQVKTLFDLERPVVKEQQEINI